MNRFVPALACIVSLLQAGCLSTSDVRTAQAPEPLPAGSALQIAGLERFHTAARVVSNVCGLNRYETDRRQAAQAEIVAALAGEAAARPGGLRFEAQSLDVRLRCFATQCVADAELTALLTGQDRRGAALRIEQSGKATDSMELTGLCISAMPTISRAADSALQTALAEMKRRLAATAP